MPAPSGGSPPGKPAHYGVAQVSGDLARLESVELPPFRRAIEGFEGVVVSDALDMAALTKRYAADVGRAAVEAFKAGNDLLLIPADLAASWRAMVDAVKSAEVDVARIDEAVLKILRWKAGLGLHQFR